MSAPVDNAPAISVRNLHKSFGDHAVLRGVSLEVSTGETFTLLGGSGTGKSVCLRHLIGLLRADTGAVQVLGQPLPAASTRELIALRRRCGMVFQSAALFDSLTVFDNIAYPLREHLDWNASQIADRVGECLDAVGLPGVETLLPEALSGGMRKRVGVARAIAMAPELILYDEPTTGLDPANSKRIGELIRSLQERLRVTSVVVTHDLELCFAVSDRVALLKGGRVAVEADVEGFRQSTDPVVRAYFDGAYDEPEPMPTQGDA